MQRQYTFCQTFLLAAIAELLKHDIRLTTLKYRY